MTDSILQSGADAARADSGQTTVADSMQTPCAATGAVTGTAAGRFVTVVGAGLAGSEAAWQLAERGIKVKLCEMRPGKQSPAHKTGDFAELVCSNSLRGDRLENAVGLLKEELRRLGSVIMRCADATRVPAGGALAVDRDGFSRMVTELVASHPNIEVVRGEVTEIPDGDVIIAAGPLASDAMSERVAELTGGEGLHFYDAAAPIVAADSIDMEKAYVASRYGRGTPDYINCPFTEEEYDAFYRELIAADEAEVHGFEDKYVFEGCMPVEVMARRGRDTLCFGPLKPVGLPDPRTGKLPFAVAQLRRDNADGTMYNIVGFQTHLRFPEQRRVFSMIPGLENAEYLRYGVMHRNTFLDSPRLLDAFYRLRSEPRIAFAGQITGVEGYVESCASGYYAGVTLARRILGLPELALSDATAIGALARYVSDETVADFQPMNVNFGIIKPYTKQDAKRDGVKRDKVTRYGMVAARALDETEKFGEAVGGLARAVSDGENKIGTGVSVCQ